MTTAAELQKIAHAVADAVNPILLRLEKAEQQLEQVKTFLHVHLKLHNHGKGCECYLHKLEAILKVKS